MTSMMPSFSEEHLYNLEEVSESKIPQFAAKILFKRFSLKKIIFDLKYHLWEDPYLFKIFATHIIRRGVLYL